MELLQHLDRAIIMLQVLVYKVYKYLGLVLKILMSHAWRHCYVGVVLYLWLDIRFKLQSQL